MPGATRHPAASPIRGSAGHPAGSGRTWYLQCSPVSICRLSYLYGLSVLSDPGGIINGNWLVLVVFCSTSGVTGSGFYADSSPGAGASIEPAAVCPAFPRLSYCTISGVGVGAFFLYLAIQKKTEAAGIPAALASPYFPAA